MSDDATLGQQDTATPSPFERPVAADASYDDPIESVADLSMEELLTSARRVRTHATICMRADLQAEHDAVLEELAGLVDAEGKVVVDEDASLGESPAARAQHLADRLHQIKRTMQGSMRKITFEGMDSDAWAAFHAAHHPKRQGADLTEFNTKLIAECAIKPTLTVDQVRQLRKTLGAAQITLMANKAWIANNQGGISLPKSSSFLTNLARSTSAS